jgi:hypothetical protein
MLRDKPTLVWGEPCGFLGKIPPKPATWNSLIPAIFLLALQEPAGGPVHGRLWIVLAILIFLFWGGSGLFHEGVCWRWLRLF